MGDEEGREGSQFDARPGGGEGPTGEVMWCLLRFFGEETRESDDEVIVFQ